MLCLPAVEFDVLVYLVSQLALQVLDRLHHLDDRELLVSTWLCLHRLQLLDAALQLCDHAVLVLQLPLVGPVHLHVPLLIGLRQSCLCSLELKA